MKGTYLDTLKLKKINDKLTCYLRIYSKKPILPVILSQSIRDVIIRPKGVNNDSRSGWDIFFGNPDTYKLAPLIDSELGRAKDTYTVNR